MTLPKLADHVRRVRNAPSESEEQRRFVAWCGLPVTLAVYPDLAWIYAVPNGGHRHKATAGRMKAEGVRAGYPDLGLDVARGSYHGWRCELKRARKSLSRVQPRQIAWHDRLRGQGYRVDVCYGFEEAKAALLAYLNLRSEG
jgi:hypothetical protein